MRRLLLALVLSLFGTAALAQGCGPQNPNCIVPTAPVGTSNNQAASTEFVANALAGSLTAGTNITITGTNPTTIATVPNPTFATSVTSPIHIGGTAASSSLTLESTSGVGTTDSIIFKTGSQITRWTLDTNGVAFFTPGAFTLYDASSWAQTPVLRIANDLTAAGSGVAGSANQFALNVQVQIPSATSSGASYQKSAAIFGCQTADPSSATTRDCVGADARGFITNNNATGRAWGGVDLAQINSGGTGDGLLVGREIDVANNGTDQASINTTTSKYGLQIVPQVGNITAGIFLTNSGSGAYHHGIYADPAVFASTSTANFLTLNGKYTLDKNGLITQTTSTTAGVGLIVGAVTQTSPNAGDTSDGAIQLQYTLSANSATNELIARVFKLISTNSLTGGGALSNARIFNLQHNNSASTTTTQLDGIYIESTAGGTVTTGAAIRIANWLGTTKWGIADDSGGNWYNATGGLSLGNTTGAGNGNLSATGTVTANDVAVTGTTVPAIGINASAANTLSLFTRSLESLRITADASANRLVTVNASNGANPTINVTGGNLAITPAVVGGSFIQATTYVQTGTTTVAGLPACAAGTKGAHHFVTDGNTANAFRGAVTGGGALQQWVTCDGTAWLQG